MRIGKWPDRRVLCVQKRERDTGQEMEEMRKPGTVIFNDVAVCFSQRDWQLLADWQRKLYRNIMKEIHGALSTLGYEIANPGILVRISQSDESYFNEELSNEEMAANAWVSLSDEPKQHGAEPLESVSALPPIKPDLLLRVKMEDISREQSSQTSAAKAKKKSEDSSSMVFNPELALWIKQEEEHSFPEKVAGQTPGLALRKRNRTKGKKQTQAKSKPGPSKGKPVVLKRKSLRLKDKILVLCAYENKVSLDSLATQFGVSRAQVVQIIKRREELLDALQNNESGDRKRRRRRTTNDQVNSAVWDWLVSVRGTDIRLSGRIIREKALQIAQDMGVQDFKASNGWLESFKKTHNINRGAVPCSIMAFEDDRMDEWFSSLVIADP